MSTKRFLAVLHARNLEFLRDRSALAWNLILPFFIVLGFGYAFSGGSHNMFKVGVIGPHDPARDGDAFFATQYVEFIPFTDLERAQRKVEHHQIDMLIDVRTDRYWVNGDSPKGYLLERMLNGASAPGARFQRNELQGQLIRYVDWLAPGIFAMNMMFSCLFGIGYVIVRYRKNGVLKRLKATPLSASEFLSAQVVSRLLLVSVITTIVYIGCNAAIDFAMNGGYAPLIAVYAVGAVALISLGLLTAARLSSEEFAGGVLNLMTWPMMLLSGVWISLEGAHPWVQTIAQIFPLTHMVDGARAVMLDGAGFGEIMPQLLTLGGMTVLFLGASALLFRWE
jgi:ABC-type multidrug transport system permease subunit